MRKNLYVLGEVEMYVILDVKWKMFGKNNFLPLAQPVKNIASMTDFWRAILFNGGFKLRSITKEAPILRIRLCKGNPGGFCLFKNSTGKRTATFNTVTESIDLYVNSWPSNDFKSELFIEEALSSLEVKIDRSEHQSSDISLILNTL